METFSKIIDDTQKYIGDRFSDLQKPPLVWMMSFDFKVWPKSFSGAGTSYGFTAIENLAEFYRQHGFFTDEAKNMPKEWTTLRTPINSIRTLADIVCICVNGGLLEDFDPSYALDHWLNYAKKSHLKGHTLTGPCRPQKKTLAREVNETELEMQMLEEFMPLEE